MPKASVGLSNPQCLHQEFGGNGFQDETKYTVHLTEFDIQFDAPYALTSLLILSMDTSSSTSNWSAEFVVNEGEVSLWSESLMSLI